MSRQRALSLSLVTLAVATLAPTVRADVVGRLKFSVKNAADEKPVAGATITLKDSAGVKPPVVLTTGPDGVALSGPLENRAWTVTVASDTFQKETREIAVPADVTTDVEILLEPLTEKVIKITGDKTLVRAADTSSSTRRDADFFKKFPVSPGNNQSLNKAIRAVPGFADDSSGQVHPRGEHASSAVYINGFLLPGAFQGRAGAFLAPDAIQNLEVMTGGYAPEYGGELAAVLNLTLRAGTVKPFVDYTVSGGSFGMAQLGLNVGGQAGAAIGAPDADGFSPKKLGYFLGFTARTTDNALESPQPDRQTAHNRGRSATFFGNLDYNLGKTDTLSLIVNSAPANTQVANRTGLSSRFSGVGQGFGYGGARNPDGSLAGDQSDVIALPSQQDAGQRIEQNDRNDFATLQYRKTFRPELTGVFSLGTSRSILDIVSAAPTPTGQLPQDSSIEFFPDVRRHATQNQIQGSLTYSKAGHTIKFGALFADQSGNESYRFIPGSVAAYNALEETDPRLVSGLVDGGGDAARTRQVGNEFVAPTLDVRRDGYYAAAFVQDTFQPIPKATLNYGVRFDSYRQSNNLGQGTVNKSQASPRVNLAYAVLANTVVRASYNKLFTTPPAGQIAIFGDAVVPQTSDLIETSIERQLPQRQVVKLATYRRWSKNGLDTALLVEGTQIGTFTTANVGNAIASGVELSYEKQPRGGIGLGGYFAWASSTAKVFGGTVYADHDQKNTITGGATYTCPDGTSFGLNAYYGSGFASSVIDNDIRNAHTEVNAQVSSGPRFSGGKVGVTLAVENLFDSRQVINFNSPFSGTRFQQGRRIVLGVNGRF